MGSIRTALGACARAMTIAAALLTLAPPDSVFAFCTGDCDHNGGVSGSEAVLCQGIAVGSRPLSLCAECDCDVNGVVSEDEANQAQQNVLNGCSAGECPRATALPSSTATRTPPISTPTRTGTLAASTPTANPTTTANAPTPTRTPGGTCVGDCDDSHMVTVPELVTGVNIALSRAAVSVCTAFDANASGNVSVDELVQGVNDLLHGCP